MDNPRMADDALPCQEGSMNTNQPDGSALPREKVASFLAGKASIEVWPDRLDQDGGGRLANAIFGTPARVYRYRRWLRLLTSISLSPVIDRDMISAFSCGALNDALHMTITAAQQPDVYNDKIVSRTYKYIWIGNPKVASRSLLAALLSTDPNAEIIRNKSMADICTLYPEAEDYYSFAFVRHPFRRALSFYSELRFAHQRYPQVFRLRKEKKRQDLFKRFFGLAEVHNFDDYCQWLNTWCGSDSFADRHFLSQHLLLRLDGGRLPDFIGRFENIESDLSRIARHLDMPTLVLPRLNTMAGWQPTPEALRTARLTMATLLTERNKALLRTRYANDFELGDYSSA